MRYRIIDLSTNKPVFEGYFLSVQDVKNHLIGVLGIIKGEYRIERQRKHLWFPVETFVL